MVLVIICRKCHKANDTYKEAEFDYWQWFDATENFDDPHGRFCDVCGKEFMEYYIKQIDKANDLDELTEIVEERAAFDDRITNKEYCEIVEYANIKIKNWRHK